MKKHIILLVGIVSFGLLIRIYSLHDVPSGFHRDEAFLGYNALSLLKTGKDISNNFLPTHLSSFLYTPAGYSYLTVPFIAVLGLTEVSVRLPSVIFGTATIVLIFVLARKVYDIFLSTKGMSREFERNFVGLFASFSLAVSPWHVILSRTASVSSVVTFLIVLGIVFFLLAVDLKSKKWLVGSFIALSVSLGFYIAPYSFLVLFIPILLFIFRHSISKRIAISLFVILILVPFLITFLSPTLALRVRSLSITNSPNTQLIIDERIRDDGAHNVSLPIIRALHNKPLAYSSLFFNNYSSHFSYSFFFTDKIFPDRYRIPEMGLLYIYELPLLLIGGWCVFSRNKKLGGFLVSWVLISPLGSSFASDDVPNLQRTLFMLPPLTLFVGFGGYTIFQYLRRYRQISKIAIGISVLIIAFNIFYFVHSYFIHGVLYRPWYRQEGYKNLVAKVNQQRSQFNKVVITNRESAPTIFVLFYNQYDPKKFQGEVNHAVTHDYDRVGFSNYKFSEEECPLKEVIREDGNKEIKGEEDVLYVNSGLCKNEGVKIIDTIRRADNSVVFYIVTK